MLSYNSVIAHMSSHALLFQDFFFFVVSIESKHERTTITMIVVRDFNTVDIMFPIEEHSNEIQF